jgi:hypothetical protein
LRRQGSAFWAGVRWIRVSRADRSSGMSARAEPLSLRAVAGPPFTAAVQIKLDRPGIALVHQARDLGLEHDSAAGLRSSAGGVLPVSDQLRGDLANPVAHKQLGSVRRRQLPPAG